MNQTYKTYKTRRNKTKSKHHKHKKVTKKNVTKNRRKVMLGGFGRASNPFIGAPWNAEDGGKYFKNGTPIGVGGIPVFPGDASQSPQHPPRSQNNVTAFSNPDSIAYNASKLTGGSKKSKKRNKNKSNKRTKSNKKRTKMTKNKKGGSSIRPLTPTPILNGWRTSANLIGNAWRQFQGTRPLSSPLPWIQNSMEV
jgi:hypothetical protein